jgi:hypothetical protein
MHFGDVEHVLLAEHGGSHLFNCLAELNRLLNREQSKLMEILKRRVRQTVKLLSVDLASQLVEEVQSEVFTLHVANRKVPAVHLVNLVQFLFSKHGCFDEHRSQQLHQVGLDL